MLPIHLHLMSLLDLSLKALDVWAMGVTLYCFVFGKASVRIFSVSATDQHLVYKCWQNKVLISHSPHFLTAPSGNSVAMVSVTLCFTRQLSLAIIKFNET